MANWNTLSSSDLSAVEVVEVAFAGISAASIATTPTTAADRNATRSAMPPALPGVHIAQVQELQ
jgi:voltage-gated potassium channel Kch